MFKFIKNLFKKKINLLGLEEAKNRNLITEEEFLELKVNRAMAEFEDFKIKKKKK